MSVAVIVALMAGGAAAGVGTERAAPDRADALSRGILDLLLRVVLPPLYLVLATDLVLDASVGAGLLVAYAELGLVGVLAWGLGARVLRLPRASTGALVVCAILANTGYLGLPLTSVLLGREAVGPALAWDGLVSGPMFYAVAFVVGGAFSPPVGSEEERPGAAAVLRLRLRRLVRNPLLWAVLLGLLVPGALVPELAVTVAQDALVVVLVVGFAVVGLQLAAEVREGGPRALRISGPVGVVLGLRLAVAPALVLAAALLIVDLPDAFLLQAAMPAGMNALVVAHACRLDLRLTAAAIAWSHAAVGLAALVLVALA